MAAKSKIEILIEAKVKEAINNLNKAEDEIDKMGKAGKTAGMSFSQLGTAVKGFISALAIREVAQFSIEVSKLYGNAVSLRRSLANLAAKEGTDIVQLMNDLRKATAGTVSDLELMRNATQAKFLGIDLKNLPVLLEFARRRAKDTGQDVNYLVESIVTGIGRKSPLILDNLGLKMNQLREAVKEVAIAQGDWNGKVDQNLMDLHLQEAAVLIAKKAIKESGQEIDTATDSIEQFNAEWENAKIILGYLASGPLKKIVDQLNELAESLGKNKDILTASGLDKIFAQAKLGASEAAEEIEKINEALDQLNQGKPLSPTSYLYNKFHLYGKGDIEDQIKYLNDLKKTWEETLKSWEETENKIKEFYQNRSKINKENGDTGSGVNDKIAQAEIERAKKDAEFLKELRIANIRDEYERKIALINAEYEKEKEFYKNKLKLYKEDTENYKLYKNILNELEKLHTNKIEEINTEHEKWLQKQREKEIKAEKEKQEKIREEIEKTNEFKKGAFTGSESPIGIVKEYAARIKMIEDYFNKQIALAADNKDQIIALEEEKNARINQLTDQYSERYVEALKNQSDLFNLSLTTMEAAYAEFWNNLLRTDMTGKEKREAILRSMENAFINTLSQLLSQFIRKKLFELVFHKEVEQEKTNATLKGAIARNAISISEISISEAKTSANTQEAASEFFAAHAGIPFVGYAIAAAFVAAMMAMLAGIGKKASGGLVRREDLSRAFVPSGEDGLLGVQENEYVIRRDRVTPETLPLLDAINYGPNFKLSRLPGPPQPTVFSSGGYQRVIEREVPVSGEIVVRTVAPELAQVEKHYINVNRTILYPDTKYIKQNLETEDNPFS